MTMMMIVEFVTTNVYTPSVESEFIQAVKQYTREKNNQFWNNCENVAAMGETRKDGIKKEDVHMTRMTIPSENLKNI